MLISFRLGKCRIEEKKRYCTTLLEPPNTRWKYFFFILEEVLSGPKID